MRHELRVDPAVFAGFPGYACLVVYAENLYNGPSDDYSTATLREAEDSARAVFAGAQTAEHPHIQAWHAAFKRFGSKPKRFPCGAESLLKRVLTGQQLPAISRLVDLYNAISLKRVIPIGGEDWDHLASELLLYPARGDEPFVTFGADGEHVDHPSPGEVIWADAMGATVRRWNWRQCARTRITPETVNAYFVLDALPPYGAEDLRRAGEELIDHLRAISPQSAVRSELISGLG